MITKSEMSKTIVFLSILFSSQAFANDWYVWHGNKTTTALSGNAGTIKTTKLLPNNSFLYSISGYEKSDKPCRFNLDGWYGPQKVRQSTTYPLCSTSSGWKKAELNRTQRKTVRALKVCLNNNGSKVKGVKLYASVPNNQGVFSPNSATAQYQRSNCNNWGATVSCPSGQAAVGVRFESQNGSVRGMRLVCSQSRKNNSAPTNAGQSSGLVRATGGSSYTASSGHASALNKSNVLMQGSGFVTTVGIGERSNNPCYVDLRGWSNSGPLMKSLTLCPSTGTQKASIGNYPAVKDQERVIVAIKACLNNAIKATPFSPNVPGDEVKGIKVYGAVVNPQGTVTPDGTFGTFSRPNCKHWRNKVSCPSGKAAVGLRVGYHNNNVIRNVSLVCKTVVRD